jgi:hypothetical protein
MSRSFTCRTCGHADLVHDQWVGRCLHNTAIMAKDPTDNDPCPCVGMDKPLPTGVKL